MQRSPPLLEKNCNAKLAEDLSKPINCCWAWAKMNPRQKLHPLGKKTSHWPLSHAFKATNQPTKPTNCKGVVLTPSTFFNVKGIQKCGSESKPQESRESTIWGYCMISIDMTDSYQVNSAILIWDDSPFPASNITINMITGALDMPWGSLNLRCFMRWGVHGPLLMTSEINTSIPNILILSRSEQKIYLWTKPNQTQEKDVHFVNKGRNQACLKSWISEVDAARLRVQLLRKFR